MGLRTWRTQPKKVGTSRYLFVSRVHFTSNSIFINSSGFVYPRPFADCFKVIYMTICPREAGVASSIYNVTAIFQPAVDRSRDLKYRTPDLWQINLTHKDLEERTNRCSILFFPEGQITHPFITDSTTRCKRFMYLMTNESSAWWFARTSPMWQKLGKEDQETGMGYRSTKSIRNREINFSHITLITF